MAVKECSGSGQATASKSRKRAAAVLTCGDGSAVTIEAKRGSDVLPGKLFHWQSGQAFDIPDILPRIEILETPADVQIAGAH